VPNARPTNYELAPPSTDAHRAGRISDLPRRRHGAPYHGAPSGVTPANVWRLSCKADQSRRARRGPVAIRLCQLEPLVVAHPKRPDWFYVCAEGRPSGAVKYGTCCCRGRLSRGSKTRCVCRRSTRVWAHGHVESSSHADLSPSPASSCTSASRRDARDLRVSHARHVGETLKETRRKSACKALRRGLGP